MQLDEAKYKFIQSWGSLGSQWGINRTMAQIHALFLISEEALSTEEVMEILQISRGNANMNIRTLIDWGLLYKEFKIGERKEFFTGEKDIWTVARRVIKVRQQKELIPLLHILQELGDAKIDGADEKDVKHFSKQIEHINQVATRADRTLTKISNSEESWFTRTFLKLFK